MDFNLSTLLENVNVVPKRLADFEKKDPPTYWNFVNPLMFSLYTFSASLLLTRRPMTSTLLSVVAAPVTAMYGNVAMARAAYDQELANVTKARLTHEERAAVTMAGEQIYREAAEREVNFGRTEQSYKMQRYVDRKLGEEK